MTRYCPEYYSPDEVYPTEAQTQNGIDYGPTGAEFTGTLTGTATLPPSADTAVGRIVTYSETGVAESGVDVSVQVVSGPVGVGLLADSKVWTRTSDADGLVEFAGLLKGWRYVMWRGDRLKESCFRVPETEAEGLDSNSNFLISNAIGLDVE